MTKTRRKKKSCPECVRARWILTVLMLLTMAAVLYLDQLAQ